MSRWEGRERSVSDILSANSYAAKLKDPRWQKRRLEKLESAGWACEYCGDTTSNLQVHHRWYLKGYEPWDYGIDQLECLCEKHHEMASRVHKLLKERLSRLPLWAQMEITQGCLDRSPVDVILADAFYGHRCG